MRKISLLILTMLLPFGAWATSHGFSDSDTEEKESLSPLTAITIEGVEMTFGIISEEEKTVQVGIGDTPAIDRNMTGIVTIPSTVEGYRVVAIGDFAFSGCSQLTYVRIPEGVKTIGENAFSDTSFEYLDLPDGVYRFGIFSVASSKIKFIITGGVDYLYFHPRALDFSDVEAVYIRLDDGTLNMYGNGSTGLWRLGYYPENPPPRYEEYAIPEVVYAGDKTYTVTKLGPYAFKECNKMEKLTIPKTIRAFAKGSGMFSGCTALRTIVSYIEEPFDFDEYLFDSEIYAEATLYVPADTKAKYEAAQGWKYFQNIVEMAIQNGEAKPVSEGTTINPSDKAVPGKTVITDDGLVISLGENDTVDKENSNVTVTTVMTPDELKELLKQTKPDDPRFYNKFRGMYSMLAAGGGIMEITFQTLGDYDFIVMQGTDKVARYKQDEKGTIRVKYDSNENEWVFFFPSVSAAARAKMGREAIEGGLVIYSIKLIPGGVIPGDANNDGTVNAADIVEVVNYIMNHPSEKYNEKAADANGDGVVNAADIVAIVNIIMGN